MTDFISFWAHQILRHTPTVTLIGLSMAACFMLMYFSKRWRECGLLAGVCVAYALAPYLPGFGW